jgi:uncharacterized protein YndB with AHSA1/START domain
MNGPVDEADESKSLRLVVRRTIRATAQQLFEAWTQPEHLIKWWGPRPVICVDAQIDLRPGGTYRIANQLPDGTVLWISGEFEIIEPNRKLVYSWRAGAETSGVERVTVQFEQRGNSTEVIVIHERIPDRTTRDRHQDGWDGCLTGLAAYFE